MKAYMQEVLEHLVTPERKELLLDVINTLEVLNFEAALDEIQQVCEMQSSGMSDTAMLLARINDVIFYAHKEALRVHRVVMDERADLKHTQAVLKTLSEFDSFIIPEQIDLILGGAFSNEEMLGHLVPMFNRIRYEEIVDHILEVDPILIERIREVIAPSIATRGATDIPPAPVSRIRLINRLVAKFGKPNFSMMFDLADSGMRVGASFEDMYAMAVEGLDRLEPTQVPTELFGMIAFSDVALDQIRIKLIETIDDIEPDGREATNLKRQCEPLIAALEEFKDEVA